MMEITFAIVLLMIESCLAASDRIMSMSIYPREQNIIRKENDDLNLTCKITSQDVTDIMYNLSWNLPIKTDLGRVNFHESPSELTVTIRELQQSDAGRYVCQVSGGGYLHSKIVTVFVKSEKKKCFKQFFRCGNDICIPSHYMCDGHPDCPDIRDESFKYCGADPCKGKIRCGKRCIPKKLCCDPSVDTNCSVNYIMPCCQNILHPDLKSSELPVLQQYSHASFLQCTAFTIAICTIVFFCIITLFLVHMCRLYVRRTAMQTPLAFRLSRPHWLWPWHPSRVDRQMQSVGTRYRASQITNESTTFVPNHSQQLCRSEDAVFGCATPLTRDENFVLLTFIEGHGYQLADGFVKPPSYNEALLPPHNQGHPPPPYTSTLDLTVEIPEAGRTIVEGNALSAGNQPPLQ